MKSILDEKITSRWFWIKSQEQHNQRVKLLKSKISTRIDNVPPKIRRNSHISIKFHQSESKKKIQEENIKLLNSLTDISSGKRASSMNLILSSTKDIPKPKSLIQPYRKQEAKRIINDNEALAKRLMRSRNGLSFKKLDAEWQNSERYKKTISKAKFRFLPKISQKSKLFESKNTDKSSKKRTNSMYEESLRTFAARDTSKNLSVSPILDSRSNDLFGTDSYKQSLDLTVTGQKKSYNAYTTVKKQPSTKKNQPKLDPLSK